MSTKLIKACLMTPGVNHRWGLPLLLEGSPGVGKTSIVKQIGAELGLHVETITASIRSPEDFLGLPVPRQLKNGTTTVDYAPPIWARRAAEACKSSVGGAVVFLDEVTTCAPAVQAALLRVVNEGMVGDFELPKGVRFLLAANPASIAAGGFELAPPLANRFGHVNFDNPDLEQWTSWLLSDGGDDDHTASAGTATALEKGVMAKWPSAFAKAKGNVAGFLKSKTDLLMKMPNADDPNASKAWASPRTWELACRSIAGIEVHGLTDADADDAIAAFVGNGVAAEFLQYQFNNDLPDPAKLLDGKETWEHDPGRPDRTNAVLSSCAALVCPKKASNRKERAGSLWKIVAAVAEDTADVAIPTAHEMNKAKLAGSEFALESMASLKPVMSSIGLL